MVRYTLTALEPLTELAMPVASVLLVSGLTLWTTKLSADWVGVARAGWWRCLLALIYLVLACAAASVGAARAGYPATGALAGLAVGLFLLGPTLGTSMLRGLGIGIVALLAVGMSSAVVVVAATIGGAGPERFGLHVVGLAGLQGPGHAGRGVTGPRLAQMERATRTLCDCAADYPAPKDYALCRRAAKHRMDTVVEALTRTRLSEPDLAAFLTHSSRAALCAGEAERRLAQARARPGAETDTLPTHAAQRIAGSGPSDPQRLPYRYRQVAMDELAAHLGKLVRLHSSQGWTKRDELVEVRPDTLVLRGGRADNFRTYDVSASSIVRLEVLDRWPQ